MKARKKPIVIDVWQFLEVDERAVLLGATEQDYLELRESGYSVNLQVVPHDGEASLEFSFSVKTLEGTMTGHVGDYLARGIEGELYPIAKDIFERTYDLVDDDQ